MTLFNLLIKTINEELHSDILLHLNTVNHIEMFDSYYHLGCKIPYNYQMDLSSILIQRMHSWLFALDNKDYEKYLFTIDISDEYIGGFRILNENHDCSLEYGIIRGGLLSAGNYVINSADEYITIHRLYSGPEIVDNFKYSILSNIKSLQL
jgi:hypothetical protein